MNGELEGGPNPKIYFDLCKIDLPFTPFVDIDLNTIEISYADSIFIAQFSRFSCYHYLVNFQLISGNLC